MSLSDSFLDWLEKIEPICKDCMVVFSQNSLDIGYEKILFLFFSFQGFSRLIKSNNLWLSLKQKLMRDKERESW